MILMINRYQASICWRMSIFCRCLLKTNPHNKYTLEQVEMLHGVQVRSARHSAQQGAQKALRKPSGFGANGYMSM